MDANGAIAYPYLDRIRAEMNSIQEILVHYRFKGYINVDEIPKQIVCFRKRTDQPGVISSLQHRYHSLFDQEVDLVLASKDKAVNARLLAKIRMLISEIEKLLFSARSEQPLMLPQCLASCYAGSRSSDRGAPVLLERYHTLTHHEFRIALVDMENANRSQIGTESSPVDYALTSASEHSTSSAVVDNSNEFPPAYIDI